MTTVPVSIEVEDSEEDHLLSTTDPISVLGSPSNMEISAEALVNDERSNEEGGLVRRRL